MDENYLIYVKTMRIYFIFSVVSGKPVALLELHQN